jgi:hypothetical protein
MSLTEPEGKNLLFVSCRKSRCFALLSMTSGWFVLLRHSLFVGEEIVFQPRHHNRFWLRRTLCPS